MDLSINSVSPSLRDSLLNLDIVSNTVTSNGLSSLLASIGLPAQITFPSHVIPQQDFNELNNNYRQDLLRYNTIPRDTTITDTIISNIPQGSIQSMGGVDNNFDTDSEIYRQNNLRHLVNNPPHDFDISEGIISESPLNTSDDINVIATGTRQDNLRHNIIDSQYTQYITDAIISDINNTPQLDLNRINNINRENNLRVNPFAPDELEQIDITQSTPLISSTPQHEYNVSSNFNYGGDISIQPSNILGDYVQGNNPFANIGGLDSSTRLARVGQQQLAFAFAQNVAFNTIKETAGHINLDPLSLIKGNSLITPNYSITVSKGTIGKVFDYMSKVMGIGMPVSLLASDSWEYTTKGNVIDSLSLNNSLISNTGKGHVNSLFNNLGQNFYQPDYKDTRLFGKDGLNANYYIRDNSDASSNKSIPLDAPTDVIQSYLQGADNFDEDKINYIVYPDNLPSASKPPFNNPNSLIYKTYNLFQEGKIKTMITSSSQITEKSEINTAGIDDGSGLKISKGSAITKDGVNFCRTWSTIKRYNRVSDLQKHKGLDPLAGKRYNIKGSVLEDNGFVRMAPYINDDKKNNIKRFMLSIENLAWSDFTQDLPPQEVGPGDLLNTNRRGRIMWFPPYDISFNENVSVNWDESLFIGRGEPVYTYNNTIRAGNLQFKIVVDHPTILNDLRYSVDQWLIAAVTAGCTQIPTQIKRQLTPNEEDALNVILQQGSQTKTSNNTFSCLPYKAYFPNDRSDIDEDIGPNCVKYEIEDRNDGGIGTTFILGKDNNLYPDPSNKSKNKDWFDFISNDSKIKELFQQCPSLEITITGYASNVGDVDNNKLIQERVSYIKGIISSLIPQYTERIKTKYGEPIRVDGDTDNDTCNDDHKEARRVEILFSYNSKYDPSTTPDLIDNSKNVDIKNFDLSKISSRFINEAEYFYKISQDNKFIFDDIRQKLRFFHPAFHSITPEGLNQRLTFLEQCTKQGPTTNNNSNPNNLAFGRPPICILRIGDFYHTKIVIENLAISYEPLLWDLNPEGIGVQPMIAVVDLSFKFIGGQSLEGPINQLQNAVSFNFFANNEIFSERPDRITIDNSGNGTLSEGYRPNPKYNELGTKRDNNVITTSDNTLNYYQEANLNKNSTQSSSTGLTTSSNAEINFSATYSDNFFELVIEGGVNLIPKGVYLYELKSTFPAFIAITNKLVVNTDITNTLFGLNTRFGLSATIGRGSYHFFLYFNGKKLTKQNFNVEQNSGTISGKLTFNY